jgi:hypothetical protein
MFKNKNLLIRKAHRYLGLFIGIQFLCWTISGLYFSWNNIDNVHGDHLRKPAKFLSAEVVTVSPSVAVNKLREIKQVDSVHSVHLIRVLDKPVYQVSYFSGHVGEGVHLHLHYALADATTGELRTPIVKEEAIAIAKENIIENAALLEAKYLESVNDHHEYRESQLPAWAVSFSEPKCTVYVSADKGQYQTIRHDQWRVFDFLWMFHTMDYSSRDNFNNWLLKGFSIFGLITILSGFLLFVTSSPTIKRFTRKR